MRVLIAGCGYVGQCVGATLASQGHKVFGLRRTHEGAAAMQHLGILPLVGDLTNPEDLHRLPGPFDWVVNTTSAGPGGLESYRQVYLDGTRRLLEWLTSQPLQRYVYTSSTGVYGQDDGSMVDEHSPTEPEADTGQVLLATEKLLLAAARNHQFPAVILRVAGIYGPGRGYWLKQFLAGEAKLEGEGTRWLNMVHRDDVAGSILAALTAAPPGEVFNVVDDEPVPQRKVFEWLAAVLAKPMPPQVPENAALRKRAVTNKRVSNAKLKVRLGYTFSYPTFREGYAAELERLGVMARP